MQSEDNGTAGQAGKVPRPAQAGELEALTRSASWEITVGGKTLTLTPLTFGELPRFLRGGREFLAELDARVGQPLDLLAVIETAGESLRLAMAIATRQPNAFIDSLALDEVDRLLGKLMEVNQDFFARRLMAAMQSLAEAASAAPGPSAASSGGPGPASA